MHNIASGIERCVAESAARIRLLSETEMSTRPAPGKWSKKEIIGHLVDSAQHNIQRFVRGQYLATPHVVYEQNEWVALGAYQEYDTAALLDLWAAFNRHLCHVLAHMQAGHYERTCDIGKEAPEVVTLTALAEDYLAHMQHHLRAVLPEQG